MIKAFKFLAIIGIGVFTFSSCKDSSNVSPTAVSAARASSPLVINNVSYSTVGDSVVVPATALAFIKTNYAGYTVLGGHKLNMAKGVIVYEVDIKMGTTAKDVYFDVNWAFVSDKAEGNGGGGHGDANAVTIDPKTIPASVSTLISTNYAGYTVVKAESETHNGVASNEIDISNGTTMKALIFDTSWKFVSEQTGGKGGNHGGEGQGGQATSVALTSIPAAVTTFITATYPGYTTSVAESETHNGVASYELKIVNGTASKELIFDANWKFVSEQVGGGH